MTEIVSRDARLSDCGTALHRLRRGHSAALAATDLDAHHELYLIWCQSIVRKAVTVDGSLAALYGVTGTAVSNQGYIWLLVTELAVKYPKELLGRARSELSEIMSRYKELATTVLCDDPAALRFAIALGFHARDDEPEKNSKKLVSKLLDTPEIRLPVGTRFVIPLGLHREIC